MWLGFILASEDLGWDRISPAWVHWRMPDLVQDSYQSNALFSLFIGLLLQILLPLINQYYKNHCLYFLSTPAKVLGSGGHSSNKEKEMIAR